jgi:steroid delta-isomerase-like uncharacterized protein
MGQVRAGVCEVHVNKPNQTIAKSFYELFNKRDWKKIEEITDARCVVRDMALGTELKGTAGVQQWLKQWSTTCSDMRADVEVVGSSDTMVTIEGNGYGKNDGPIMTPQGALPASGKPMHVQWVDLMEFKDGKIVNLRCYYDTSRLMSQLGVGQPATQGRSPSPGVAH